MNVEWFIAERAIEMAIALVVTTGYQWFRLWRVKRHAPSAKVKTFYVTLTQQDYDGLKKKRDDVALHHPSLEQAPE